MNKKILLGLSIALVALFAIGTVSAFDLSDLGSIFGTPPDQNVTIDGETFHIPGTFKENQNVSKNRTVKDYYLFKSTEYAKGYTNKTNFINILIFDYNGTELDVNLINYNNGTPKNISGVKGFMYHDGTAYTYSYAKGNKVISIQTDKESLIAPVMA